MESEPYQVRNADKWCCRQLLTKGKGNIVLEDVPVLDYRRDSLRDVWVFCVLVSLPGLM